MAGDTGHATNLRRVREKQKLLRRFGCRVTTFVLKSMVVIAFLGVVLSFLDEYLQRRKMFTISKVDEPPARFPPVIVCPWPSFSPVRLFGLGLNVSGDSVVSIAESIEDLSGLNKNQTGRALVEAAAWRLEDIIAEVTVGDLREVYSENENNTRLWHRSYLPHGPCLTMTPPAPTRGRADIITIKLRPRPPGLDMCNREKKEDASVHERLCVPQGFRQNESQWEEYIEKEFYIYFLVYAASTNNIVYTYMANTVKKIAQGSHISVTGSVLHNEMNYLDGSHNDPECLYKCVTKDAEKTEKCEAMFKYNADTPINKLCITQYQQMKVSFSFLSKDGSYQRCLRTCPPEKHRDQWVWESAKTPSSPHNITVHLSSFTTTKLTEEMIYPLNNLLADVGGAMGLFLGTSLLDLWKTTILKVRDAANVFLPSDCHLRAKTSNILLPLSEMTGELALSLIAFTHFGLTSKGYALQTTQVVVYLDSLKGQAPDNSFTSRQGVEELVLSHVASRPLGCRLPLLSPEQKCLVHCILDGIFELPIPLLDVEELSECSKDHLTFPRKMYIISDYLMEHIAESSRVDTCLTTCGPTNVTSRGSGKVHFVIDRIPRMSTGTFVCSLGGIIGLYFGFSLLRILQNIVNRSAGCFKWSVVQYKFAKVAVTTLIVFPCILMVTLQVHSFLMEQQLYSTYSEYPLEEKDMPAITTCVWPPFNPRRLLELAGLGEEYKRVVESTGVRNRSALTPLFQALGKAAIETEPQLLWMSSAWARDEVAVDVTINSINHLIPQSSNFSFNHSGVFTHCKTFTPRLSIRGSAEDFLYEVSLEAERELVSLYFAIHSQQDYPSIEPNFVNSDYELSVKTLGIHSWSGLYGENTQYGKCTLQCLEDALEDHMQCLLPWVSKQRTRPVCNMSKVAEFITAVWELGLCPKHIYGALLGTGVIERCRQQCHSCTGTFYSFSARDNFKVFTRGVTVGNTFMEEESYPIRLFTFLKVVTDVRTSWLVHNSYSLPRLLGELGGIAGMTLGASMESLLSTAVEFLQ